MATIHFDPIGKFKYTKDDMGNYHSYNDEPAIEYLDGSELKIWYKNGLIHRENEKRIIHGREMITRHPAITYRQTNCNKLEFYINGKRVLK